MNIFIKLFFITGIFFSLSVCTHASEIITSEDNLLNLPSQIILKTDFEIWTIYPKSIDLFSDYDKSYFNGFEISTLEEDKILLKNYLEKSSSQIIDSSKLKKFLEAKIAPSIFREKEDVTINTDKNNNIIFEGNGLYGRQLDIEKTIIMLKFALENNINFLTLPIIRTEPNVSILSKSLRDKGIIELVSSGETNFRRSPRNRINNINVGLSKFNGHIIKPNEEFVFGETLGPVDGSTGYRKELVIKGNKTIPEYGGGLCQVSTTAYRAILAAGFPVTKRKNHSYAVSYYTPTGLDATVYPPSVDLKFINDTPNHLLMQAFTKGNKAYYNLYGTKDSREVHMVGPYYTNRIGAPSTKTEYSDSLAAGETKVLGHAVSGVTSTWYRQVLYNEAMADNSQENGQKKDFIETIFSKYQARPNYYIIGTGGTTSAIQSKPSASDLENGY